MQGAPVALTVFLVAAAVCAAAPRARAADELPPAIAPLAGETLLESVAARGVQVYECRADAAAPGGARWVFVAPQADLFDRGGHSVGKHYAGPHWEAADGSRIVGEVRARADAPDASAIPWLKLSAKSVGVPGRFARATTVLRVNTQGGVAPTRACRADTAGDKEQVPYTADYLLYAS